MAQVQVVLSTGAQLWQGTVAAWNVATAAAVRGSALWIVAEQDCRQAVIMAANSLVGYVVPRFCPGFGPFSLGWGWLLVGFVAGWLASLHSEALLSVLERLPEMALNLVRRRRLRRAPWHQAVEIALAQTRDGPRRVVLQKLADDGDSALQLLAASAGVSTRTALARVLGEGVVHNNAAQWGL